MTAKRYQIFDIDQFMKENKELVKKYMAKDTMSLVIDDIPVTKHELLDNRVGIPSRNCNYSGLTLLHKLEFVKCLFMELYFIEKYVKILTLDHGEQPFKLWDYQKELIKSFEDNRFVLSVQSRQSGKTQTTAAHLTHRMNFFPAKKIAILANKFSQSKEIMSRVHMSFERLPIFLKKPVKSFTKISIEFEDLTEIFSAATEGGIRGKSCVGGDSYLTVRNKETGEIEKLTMNELQERIENDLRLAGKLVSGNKGKVAYHNSSLNKNKFFNVNDVIPEGWIKGRLPRKNNANNIEKH